MRQTKDIFSKIISFKTPILAIMVGFLIIYAIIGIILTFSTSSELLGSIAKIVAPLGIIGVATILAVDCFYKMSSQEKIVKILGLSTLILGAIDVILLTLIIWEVIPMYEKVGSGYFGIYSSTTTTVAYKLTMSLLSLTGFSFLSSIVLNIKNNHKIINISKYIATGFLAMSSLVSIVSNFIDLSQQDRYYGSVRMGLLQAVSWITAISLGIAVFYLSKTISWEEKKAKEITLPPKTPEGNQTVEAPRIEDQNAI